MNRWVYVAGLATAALMPLSAMASPSPSPGLDTMLAAPPSSDFVEADKTAPGVIEGNLDADQYVATANPANPSAIKATLERDGFVAAFGRTWIQRTTRSVLIEGAIAFSGGDGAKRWLVASELAGKADPNYSHPLTVTGIDQYFGAQSTLAASNTYIDAFAFVKGNDYFFLITVSKTDDQGSFASSQTTAQYIVAPDSSIPPSQWPSTSSSSDSLSYTVGRLIIPILFGTLVLGTVLFVVGRARRGRLPAIQASSVQLSPDGKFWWDGQAWRDVAQGIPPAAQRSADGQYWWDGRSWRPVTPPS